MLDRQVIINVCKDYVDPELGIDIWTLGLVYDIVIDNDAVKLLITFTSPMCPFGPQMVEDIKRLLREAGAQKVEIEITFDPPWKPSDELREMLGV